jgi:hypothetical protein
MPTTEYTPDVIAVLTHDHRAFEELFRKVQDHARFGKRRKELADQITIELIRHSVASEQHVYPFVRNAPGGQALVDRALAENAEAETLMKELEPLQPADDAFDVVLTRLSDVVRAHVAGEEGRLFPCLVATCLPMELRELGEKVQAAKATGPTRPHPSAPHTPPGNLLAAPALGLIDRVRDALAHRGP